MLDRLKATRHGLPAACAALLRAAAPAFAATFTVDTSVDADANLSTPLPPP